MTWIKVNVCFFHTYVRDLEFCFYTCMTCMYILYICLGNEVLPTKLDVQHSDHTWQSWHNVHQGTVQSCEECLGLTSTAHWSCSIHVRLYACMDIFIKWSVQQMCAASVMQNIDVMCVRREMSGGFDSPLTHKLQTIHSWERHCSWKHPSTTVSNLLQW